MFFHCTTEYPSTAETIGLNNFPIFSKRFPDLTVGFSDHSGEIYPSLAAYMSGARIFEVHVTFSKKMFGPDATSSLTFTQLKELVKGLAYLARATHNPTDKDKLSLEKSKLSSLFSRSIYLNKKIKEGDIIEFEDLSFLKPLKGIGSEFYKSIIGRRACRDLDPMKPLNWSDLNE